MKKMKLIPSQMVGIRGGICMVMIVILHRTGALQSLKNKKNLDVFIKTNEHHRTSR